MSDPTTGPCAPASPIATPQIQHRCVYCEKPADGTLHDDYGELVMGTTSLIVCAECHEEFQHEDGPWNEVR